MTVASSPVPIYHTEIAITPVIPPFDRTDFLLMCLSCALYSARHTKKRFSKSVDFNIPYGDAENAGLENAGLENAGPNRRGGKGRTGKRGNIMCMGSEM